MIHAGLGQRRKRQDKKGKKDLFHFVLRQDKGIYKVHKSKIVTENTGLFRQIADICRPFASFLSNDPYCAVTVAVAAAASDAAASA